MATAHVQNEQHRWVSMLGLELLALSVSLAAAFALDIAWFVLPALFAGPILGPLTLVYLAVSSDTNVEEKGAR